MGELEPWTRLLQEKDNLLMEETESPGQVCFRGTRRLLICPGSPTQLLDPHSLPSAMAATHVAFQPKLGQAKPQKVSRFSPT